MGDLATLSIQAVEAVLGPDPNKSLAILAYGPDHVVAQAVGIAGLVPIVEKRWRFAGKPADTALRANPNHALGIFEHCLDGIVRHGVWIVGISCVAKKYAT